MSDTLQNDQEILKKGRKNTLKGVEVDPVDRILKSLVTSLKDKGMGEKVTSVWRQGNSDRQSWLERQEEYIKEYDEFLEPIIETSSDWGSALHLPVTLTVAKTYHARMLSALLGIDPPFTVKAQKDANADRAPLVQNLMRYSVNHWANNYKGVEEVVDRILWDWVTSGCGIFKVGWERHYSRYVDVEQVAVPDGMEAAQNEDGSWTTRPKTKLEWKEVDKVDKCFDGPSLKRVNIEDLLIVGGEGDPQLADYVIYQDYLTGGELWTLVDQGVFDEKAVEKVIEAGENKKAADVTGSIKQERADIAGTQGADKNFDLERYQILEAYLKVDTNGSGIPSDVIVWVHPQTREILRATYLRRVSKSGKRPFYKIDFHKRQGSEYGVGLVELLYSLSKEIDAIHNIRMDFGILTSNPWGFYKATSSMTETKIPVEPGVLIPLDNPQSDVYFPSFSNRTAFGFQEEAGLMTYVERVTSMSDLSYGSTASQGALRTATGARALVNESNANLDVYVKRMNRGWRGVLHHIFDLLQTKLPKGFEFRLTGDDGSDYFGQVHSADEIAGMFDFELEPNSANSNKQIQLDTAAQIYQMSANPIDLQLGLITPLQRYEAIKNMYQAMGVRDFGRFVQKPQGQTRVFTPEELANRVLSGIPTPLDPTQDLAGFIEYAQHIFDDDHLMGQFSNEHAIALKKKQMEAQGLLQALESQKAQVANLAQQQANAQQSTQIQQPQAVAPAPQAPVEGA
jgi:hypothetical protein